MVLRRRKCWRRFYNGQLRRENPAHDDDAVVVDNVLRSIRCPQLTVPGQTRNISDSPMFVAKKQG